MKTTTLRALLFLIPCLCLPACAGKPDEARLLGGTAALVERSPDAGIADGIRALILESARRATRDLGSRGGYQRRDETRIALPESFVPATELMKAYGYGTLANPILGDMNRGLELAATRMVPFLETLMAQETIPDVDAALRRSEGATRQLVCGAWKQRVASGYAEILDKSLADVGYHNSVRIFVNQYNSIPVLTDIHAPDPLPYLSARGLEGLCLRIAFEEERMRNEPETRPEDPVIRELLARPR